MLTLEYIMKVARMMYQTCRDPITRRDHIPEDPADLSSRCSSDSKFIGVNLKYECSSDGDVRIVQK